MRFYYPSHPKSFLRNHEDSIQDYDIEDRLTTCVYNDLESIYLDSIDHKIIKIPSVAGRFGIRTSEIISPGRKPIIR